MKTKIKKFIDEFGLIAFNIINLINYEIRKDIIFLNILGGIWLSRTLFVQLRDKNRKIDFKMGKKNIIRELILYIIPILGLIFGILALSDNSEEQSDNNGILIFGIIVLVFMCTYSFYQFLMIKTLDKKKNISKKAT